MKHREAQLQKACVIAFRYTYPNLKLRLFHIPNGGSRNKIEASILKGQGVMPGVPDLFLAVPKSTYGGMWIEMKAEKGKLTEHQKVFFEEMTSEYKCVICRSVDEFLEEIKNYLQ